MKQIDCLIIDDEIYSINVLRDYISKVSYINLIGSYQNPIEALHFLKTSLVDLIFVDINMPELSGIDLIKMLPPNVEVIIISAYSEFAISGYDNNVLDYLLKPFSFERFLQSSQKALGKKSLHEPQKRLPESHNDVKQTDSMYLRTDRGKIVRVNFSEIIYIEGLKNYCSIFTDTERHVTLVSLKLLMDSLPSSEFTRIHKSYIIAFNKIKMIDGNMVILHNIKEKIPIGVTFREDFFSLLANKIFK